MALLPALTILASASEVDPKAAQNVVNPYVTSTLGILIGLAGVAVVVFLIYGGYQYIASTGKPDRLEHAKRVIRNALIGLVLVIAAGVVAAVLQGAFNASSGTGTTDIAPFKPISVASGGILELIVNAVISLLTNIVQAAIQPLVDQILYFLTLTPLISSNPAIFNLWLVILVIADSLFVVVIALLGFHVMSAAALGFEELDLKHLLLRIGLAFLAANMSIFFIDAALLLCNMIVSAILHGTISVSRPISLGILADVARMMMTGGHALFILVVGAVFLALVILLLLKYISRLIAIALGAVMAPFICLLWLLPPFRDFAANAARIYLLQIFTVIIDVLVIQLASSVFSTKGDNLVMSLLVGVGTILTILKIPAFISQLALLSSGGRSIKQLGGMFVSGVSHMTSRPQTGETTPAPKGQKA